MPIGLSTRGVAGRLVMDNPLRFGKITGCPSKMGLKS